MNNAANHQINHAMNNQNPNLLKPVLGASGEHGGQIITVTRINDLVREIDSTVQLDEEVEDTLLQMTDDFVDQVMNGAVMLAKHRHSTNSIEVKDVELYLERAFNMWIPGFGTDELRPYKRSSLTEAHKQRVGLIRRTIRK